jgi:glycerol-3-phosphate dehydrogenase (NAD(P)+)
VSRLAIIGGGSWGTALAIVIAPKFNGVSLWVHEEDLAARMAVTHENHVYLPGFTLPSNAVTTSDPAEALDGADVVLLVTPSHHLRSVLARIRPHLRREMVYVSATKGIEVSTLKRMSQVIDEVLDRPRVAVLSGPTFAREVAAGEPAAVVISSDDRELAQQIQQAFSGPTFRLYTNADPVGVEVGASLKNCIAIGAGICQGLGLGSNPVAALVTRGLAEICRLAVAMGGQARTLAGLAGLGDLVLTCNGELSRNRKVGFELGRGRKLDEILGSMKMVAEGVQTTYAAVGLARKFSVEMPIVEQMDSILRTGKPPRDGVRELMERSLKEE